VDRRQAPESCLDEEEERRLSRHGAAARKRPILIFDPRAGHGPGIGGSKRDSEIGIALNNGHPVYFALFFQVPEPGQTIADIEAAHVRFVEEVVRRHPHAGKPALIGNCQGGWAAALVCADRPDLTGLLVLNGAPLSYWSGVAGANPMRYRGGLLGGVWYSAFLSDLGNGKFDGANLVSNFEDLNPANTLWTKQYNLYSQLDTEEERYLAFEKWWGGFYLLTAQEIHFILDKLFIGNKFEQGSWIWGRAGT
jgi:pimeloyl-ACP methyl ester carboxylesterase